jgi:hypothetical protein
LAPVDHEEESGCVSSGTSRQVRPLRVLKNRSADKSLPKGVFDS